jgi:drug/metabolite transporter (DMT)-like permease
MTPSWLWAAFTVFAAAGQTARNAMQRELTATLGAVGATHVRFLYGFPFAILFLIAVSLASHQLPPHPTPVFWLWVVVGAITQIAGTALMLMLMEEKSFVVATAYLKTEPVFVATFGLLFLNDLLTVPMMIAVGVCAAGVMITSVNPRSSWGGARVAGLGLASGAGFGLSSIGYRGAILSLHDPNFVMASTFTLAVGLAIQAILLSAYLAVWQPHTLRALLGQWRQAMPAGFVGASASQLWFLAFALATAASVRTLGLVDVIFAQAVSRFVFRHHTTPREYAGIGLILAGAVLLVMG